MRWVSSLNASLQLLKSCTSTSRYGARSRAIQPPFRSLSTDIFLNTTNKKKEAVNDRRFTKNLQKGNRCNEIFTWRPRWLQPTRQTETAYQISCDAGARCVCRYTRTCTFGVES